MQGITPIRSHTIQRRRPLSQAAVRAVTADAVAFGLPFILYLLTLAPTVYNLDSAELTTAAATGGIVRATGYPLYTALGWLWAQLPVGDVGYRLNLMSAAAGALTVLLADRSLRRLDISPWARGGALGLLATAPYFWSMSLIAEVYTLHTALAAGVILTLQRYGARPTPARLAPPVLLMTLALGNHAATVLLVPACVLFVVLVAPRQLRRPATWLAGAVGLALGATVFLYLPLRYAVAPFNYAGSFDAAGVFEPVNLRTWDGFIWLITGRTFAAQMFGYTPAELGPQFRLYAEQLWQAFFVIGIGPGVYGAWRLWRRDRLFGATLLIAFLSNVVFYVNYRVVDKNTMYLPTYLVWALWLAVGYDGLLASWRRAYGQRLWVQRLAISLLVLPVLLALGWNWARVDRSADWSARERGAAILRQAEPDAVILGWWDTVPLVEYLQRVEGERPDVLAINRFLISGDDMETFILKEVHERPIYIDNPPLSLIRQVNVSRTGVLYRLDPRPVEHSQPISR